MSTDKRQTVMKYEGVREELSKSLIAGCYKVGERLPSERDLAKQFDVSSYTVRHALFFIEQEGMIEKVPGLGTFVRRLSPKRDASGPVANRNESKSIALILANRSNQSISASADEYHFSELNILDRYLAKAGRSLMLAYANSEDLATGRVPTALENGSFAGVILDGNVEDYHVAYLQDRGFPVVVVGNRPIHVPVSRVSLDYRGFAYTSTKRLAERCAGPIYFVTEPFCTHYTHELLDGYGQACIESGRELKVEVLTKYDQPEERLREICKSADAPFSLFLNYQIPIIVAALYQEFGYDMSVYPVLIPVPLGLMPGAAGYGMITICDVVDSICKAAVELMENLLAGGEPKVVSLLVETA